MRSMRSAQRQVELRLPGSQLPVLGKANSLSKTVKLCVFCLFVKLRLSPSGVEGPDKDIPVSRTECVPESSFRLRTRECRVATPCSDPHSPI